MRQHSHRFRPGITFEHLGVFVTSTSGRLIAFVVHRKPNPKLPRFVRAVIILTMIDEICLHCTPMHASHVITCRLSSAAETNSDEETSDLEETHPGAGADTERGLVGALRSLERTLNNHCLLLNRRLRREMTAKGGPQTETIVDRASVSGPSMPKTAQRGDKVMITRGNFINWCTFVSIKIAAADLR